MYFTRLDRRRLLAGAASLCAFASLPAVARDMDSDVGPSLVAAINDPSRRQAFYDAWLTENALKRRPAAWWAEFFDKVKAVSGGVELVSVVAREEEVLVRVRLKGHGIERILTVLRDYRAPGKVWAVFSMPRPSAYEAPLLQRAASRRELADAIRRRVEYAAKADEFSGVVRVVAPDGEAVFEGAYGFSDAARTTPMKLSDRLHLGSADKSFTAILIGRLVEQGRLSFDTRLVEVIPAWGNRAAAEKITVRHLLTHTAGLGSLWDRPAYDGKKPLTRVSELMPAFWDAEPAFEPGSRGSYSNEGFVALGGVIEALTGRSWWDELAEHIYAPAGMTRSGHFISTQPVEGRAVGFMYAEDDILGVQGRKANVERHGYRGNSCGGGYSTVSDMTGYLRKLREGKLLSRTTTELMTRPVEGGLGGYGMGFICETLGSRTFFGHGGGGPASGVDGDNWICRETGWSASILGNYDAPFTQMLSRDIRIMVAAQG